MATGPRLGETKADWAARPLPGLPWQLAVPLSVKLPPAAGDRARVGSLGARLRGRSRARRPLSGNGITPEQNVRIFVRPFASALPLGFFSFSLGMLLLGGLANGMPVFRVGASRHSVEGDLHEQLRGIGREAGVRHTL